MRELFALVRDPKGDEWTERFQADVIDKRNEHLLEAIETSLLRYRTIVVPWGGLHLPGIQRGILARGFVLRESGSRRLLSYRTILTALSHRLRKS